MPEDNCVATRGHRLVASLKGFALCAALAAFPPAGFAQANGLIAAYSFDGPTGNTLVDLSGNGYSGALTNGPIWTTGKYRSALQFSASDDGNDDNDPRVVLGRTINIPDPPFTISVWINPTDFTDHRAIISKRDGSLASEARFDLGLNVGTGHVYVFNGYDSHFSYAPPVATWTHLALVADASETRLYVNGVLQETSAALTLGANTSANTVVGGTGESTGGDNDPFNGRIDDLRIYSRALIQTEVQADMGTALGGGGSDTTSPSTPASFTASAVSGFQINLAWSPSTDDVGILGYRVERCHGTACTNFTQIAAPVGTTLNDGQRFAGTPYRYRVLAVDAAGNLSEFSDIASATTPSVPPGTGLVAAYNFDAGSGTSLADQSGNGHTGTLVNGPVWTAGKYGSALRFDASDDGNDDNDPRVVLGTAINMPDPPFTISAWIHPVDYNDWRAIFSKRDGYLETDSRFDFGLVPGTGQVYLYNGYPSYFSYAPPVDTWTHLTLVADSSGTRLYVNGSLSESRGVYFLGPKTSANAAIGATGEGTGGDNDPFKGRIDDLRIYNRALSEAEIVADVNAGVGATAGVPPTIASPAPAANAVLPADALPIISASFQPGSAGINVASAQLTVDGVNVTASATVTPEQITYERTQPFSEGAHSVQVTVTDTAGLSASLPWSFTTRSPPEVSEVTPDNITTTARRPGLIARFQDIGAGIDLSQVRLTFNGADVTAQAVLDAAGLTYTPAADLADGQYAATITLGDLAGNVSTRTWGFRVRSLPTPAPTSGDRGTSPRLDIEMLQ